MFEGVQLLFLIGVAAMSLLLGGSLWLGGYLAQAYRVRTFGIVLTAIGALVAYWAWKFPGIVDRDHQRDAEERAKQEMHATPAP
jgi:hypothetical protein